MKSNIPLKKRWKGRKVEKSSIHAIKSTIWTIIQILDQEFERSNKFQYNMPMNRSFLPLIKSAVEKYILKRYQATKREKFWIWNVFMEYFIYGLMRNLALPPKLQIYLPLPQTCCYYFSNFDQLYYSHYFGKKKLEKFTQNRRMYTPPPNQPPSPPQKGSTNSKITDKLPKRMKAF